MRKQRGTNNVMRKHLGIVGQKCRDGNRQNGVVPISNQIGNEGMLQSFLFGTGKGKQGAKNADKDSAEMPSGRL
jgi:hypothetical protein